MFVRVLDMPILVVSVCQYIFLKPVSLKKTFLDVLKLRQQQI